MEITVKTLKENGSVAFEGTLNKEQLDFILQVGVNFLLANGAAEFLPEEEDVIEAPSTDTLQ